MHGYVPAVRGDEAASQNPSSAIDCRKNIAAAAAEEGLHSALRESVGLAHNLAFEVGGTRRRRRFIQLFFFFAVAAARLFIS